MQNRLVNYGLNNMGFVSSQPSFPYLTSDLPNYWLVSCQIIPLTEVTFNCINTNINYSDPSGIKISHFRVQNTYTLCTLAWMNEEIFKPL